MSTLTEETPANLDLLLVVARVFIAFAEHRSLGPPDSEQAIANRAVRENPHRLEAPIALRALPEYRELARCPPLDSFSAPLADELDDRDRSSVTEQRG